MANFYIVSHALKQNVCQLVT